MITGFRREIHNEPNWLTKVDLKTKSIYLGICNKMVIFYPIHLIIFLSFRSELECIFGLILKILAMINLSKNENDSWSKIYLYLLQAKKNMNRFSLFQRLQIWKSFFVKYCQRPWKCQKTSSLRHNARGVIIFFCQIF